MDPKPQTSPCYACGAPMFEGEAYCPKCRSPQLVAGTKPSGIGIVIVIAIIALGCIGTILKVMGVI